MSELTKADVKVAQVGNNSNLFTHLSVKRAPVFRHTAFEIPCKLILILTASVFCILRSQQLFRIFIHSRLLKFDLFHYIETEWAYLLS